MKALLAITLLLPILAGLSACSGGFPPPGNGRGILNVTNPMMGGGG